jgi:hypothetical protein
MSLVHHVCKETEGLESLFLISKSNCAFANFGDEQSCSAAQRKLHDSKFMTVRLVSRLRKSTVEGPAGVTAPTGPAASAPQVAGAQEASTSRSGGSETKEHEDAPASMPPTPVPDDAEAMAPRPDAGPQHRDKFFVLKSLTVEDLELSVRTNIWATQSHNEEVLNSAFQVSGSHGRPLGQKGQTIDWRLLSWADLGQRISRVLGEQVWRVLWLCAYGVSHQR